MIDKPNFQAPNISVVIPLKNEEANILPLALEIEQVLNQHGWIWECIWINDGSTDSTAVVLQQLRARNKIHRVISFAINEGQSVALWYGFQLSRGGIIVTLDGDGQNDPSNIPMLVQRVMQGHTDVANGYRVNRYDNWRRRQSSKIANIVRNYFTGRTVRDVGCSIRAMKRDCVLNLPLFRGMHRFLPTLISYQGFRLEEFPVNHRPRLQGKSNYTISNRLWVGLFDLIGVFWIRRRGFPAELSILQQHFNESPGVGQQTLSPPLSLAMDAKETGQR